MHLFYKIFRLVLAGLVFLYPITKGAALYSGLDTEKEESAAPRYNFNFQDVEIPVLIRYMSQLSGKTFILGKNVRGRVTVYAPEQVTPEEAYRLFETVLEVNGYTAVPTKDAVSIVTSRVAGRMGVETSAHRFGNEYPSADRVVTRLLKLKYLDPSAIRALLQPLTPAHGLILDHGPGRSIILTGFGRDIRRLMMIIDALDVREGRRGLAVVGLENASAGQMSALLEKLKDYTGSPPGGSGANRLSYLSVPDDRTNSLILVASQPVMDSLRSLIARLDRDAGRRSGDFHHQPLEIRDSEDMADLLNRLTDHEKQ